MIILRKLLNGDYSMNSKQIYEKIIGWTRNWFSDKGDNSIAVIGISGGKDSTVSAKLLVDALGADRVLGVLMPNGKQADIQDSYDVCAYLGIDYVEVNIAKMYDKAYETFFNCGLNITEQLKINLAPRLRMTTLYAVAQSQNVPAFVINTCNLSEDFVGYSTKWGDATGDVGLLRNLTVTEILELGDYMGLPSELVHKTPSDGLCGKTDEDNLGISYAKIDDYINTANLDGTLTKDEQSLIERKYRANLHKLRPIPAPIFDISRLG